MQKATPLIAFALALLAIAALWLLSARLARRVNWSEFSTRVFQRRPLRVR
jgi:hypothetical protein